LHTLGGGMNQPRFLAGLRVTWRLGGIRTRFLETNGAKPGLVGVGKNGRHSGTMARKLQGDPKKIKKKGASRRIETKKGGGSRRISPAMVQGG